MITTNFEHNLPSTAICAKCGKRFSRTAWTGVYSPKSLIIKRSYRFAELDDYEKVGLSVCPVALCDSCAQEEQNAGRVSCVIH